MGSSCGTLNVQETAVVETWTDREILHGPVSVYCFNPFTKTVKVGQQLLLKQHECCLIEDKRDPSQSKFVYGPLLWKLENPYQVIGTVRPMTVLDQNDFLIATDKNGSKRVEVGPKIVHPLFGETYSAVQEAYNVQVNEYIVLLDKANHSVPVRHVRGPVKLYPNAYETVIKAPDGSQIRKCLEVSENVALWVRHPDGQVLMVDEPQLYMPGVGESIERTVNKTLLKESEFCIIITPTAQNLLKLGSEQNQRSFFLPPFHKFLPIKLNPKDTKDSSEIFHVLPDFLPLGCTIRTSDNVQVKVELRISFQVFEPLMYTKKPIDSMQILNWVQNELLDAFAKSNFRDFLRGYADTARSITDASHKMFNEFGIKILDVQLIHFACLDPSTQKLLDQDIITRVTKQNELIAKEADIEIMKREKEVQLQKMDIDFERSTKANAMEIKRKELDVALRMKEVDLQIQEEVKRTELMTIKRQNVVQEGAYEGEAQGRAVQSFLAALPSEYTPEQKLGLWERLRDLDTSAMIYSKVQAISMYPPGADIRQFDINMGENLKPVMAQNPFVLPSILGYSGDEKPVHVKAHGRTSPQHGNH